jgi:hypothetical protein
MITNTEFTASSGMRDVPCQVAVVRGTPCVDAGWTKRRGRWGWWIVVVASSIIPTVTLRVVIAIVTLSYTGPVTNFVVIIPQCTGCTVHFNSAVRLAHAVFRAVVRIRDVDSIFAHVVRTSCIYTIRTFLAWRCRSWTVVIADNILSNGNSREKRK